MLAQVVEYTEEDWEIERKQFLEYNADNENTGVRPYPPFTCVRVCMVCDYLPVCLSTIELL